MLRDKLLLIPWPWPDVEDKKHWMLWPQMLLKFRVLCWLCLWVVQTWEWYIAFNLFLRNSLNPRIPERFGYSNYFPWVPIFRSELHLKIEQASFTISFEKVSYLSMAGKWNTNHVPLWLWLWLLKQELKNQSHELNLELIGPFTCAS